MRTTWNGSISFGLVSIPVGLSPATAPAARQSDVQFRMLHRTCMTPIKQKRWCPVHDVEQGVMGIGSFVLAGKEKLAAVRRKGDALALETLFVAEAVKSQDEID